MSQATVNGKKRMGTTSHKMVNPLAVCYTVEKKVQAL